MILRPYQEKIINELRPKLSKNRAVILQAATGSGKTAIMGGITSLATNKNNSVWFVVPRTELMIQGSEHLLKWKIPHSMIAPGRNESNAYNVHVVSKDTLIRRWDKIKKHPDLLIFDEAHISLDHQMQAFNNFPNTKFIGLTATPERTDGRGLSEMYTDIVYGPSITYLMETGYLTPVKYFAPPIAGLENLKRQGTDYNADELEQLLLRRHVYGHAIDHYRKYTHKKPAIVFCRSVKSAHEVAEQFRHAGYSAECIEGSMSNGKRKAILNGFRDGKIDILTNCDLATYGVDIPRAEVGIMLRPTMSRALYFQMVGRILRPFPGKKHAIIFDHVNNLYEHADERYPGIPPFMVEDLDWNWNGEQKKKSLCRKCKYSGLGSDFCKDKKYPVLRCKYYESIKEIQAKMCDNCFLYYQGNVCPNCGFKKESKSIEIETIPEELQEVKPIPLKDRPIEERKEFNDQISDLKNNYNESNTSESVKRMIEIQKALGYNILWVYNQLNDEKRLTFNHTLMSEIARQAGYAPGWVFYQKKRLEKYAKN